MSARHARPIRRRIVEQDGIELLLRESGEPASRSWLFLHSAGETSHVFADLAVALSVRGHYVVIPDIPGCGASEGLAESEPGIDDYARLMAGLLDGAPDTEWVVYGRHFGARLAIALGLERPERVSAVFLDGMGLYSARERRTMRSRAAPLVVPDSDGAYLISAFQRVRDYALFFPWFDRRARARRAAGVPDAAILHRRLLEVLSSSQGIRDAYRAALDYPALERLKVLPARIGVCRRPGDNVGDIAPTLKKLRPDIVELDLDDDAPGAAARLLDALPDRHGSS